ncbi:MAG TPA: tetratricopeptide repeat protein, partial [Burkholderiales bacterium]|nr:tetratricopeptide repeat protein [Burkholderiales bacterium]
WIGMSLLIRGASLVGIGEWENGLSDIAEGMRAHSAMEAVTYQPLALSILAKGLIEGGRFDEALGAVDQALALIAKTGERFYLAELLRLKGEVHARKGALPEAESWLREAIELARRQEAKLFELRSAVSLCRLLDQAGRERAVRETLEPVYKWFEEGLDAPDVVEANAVIFPGAVERIGN